MKEKEYIEQIKRMIPENGEIPLEAIEIIDQAVRDFPYSATLWIKRGDLIQVGPLNSPYELDDALKCYRNAIEIDPVNIEAHEEIAHYFDAVMDDEEEAKKWYAKVKILKEQREKLLRRVALKCADFVRQLSYHRALENHVRGCGKNFWIYMFNNAIDLAVLDWFHLFGYHNDDLHWKKVVPDVNSFRQSLLKQMNMTEDEWKAYRETIKVYRDKDVAHIEVRPVSNVPKMQDAMKATAFYYSFVLKELAEFGDYGMWPQALFEYHQKSYEQSCKFSKLAFEATRNIPEQVY